MRFRTVIIGIVAAVLCIFVLRLFYYRVGLSQVVPGWPNDALASILPGWVSIAVLVYCCIILFSSGWVAARWNWANNWRRSLLVGGQVGLLVGCLIYDFVGIFLFGVRGQEEILRSYNVTVGEAEGTRILTEAIVQTGSALYSYFLLTILACVFLGGLGGLLSARIDRRDFWGRHPRNPEGWLFRSTAYLLTITGYINMIVALAILNYLRPRILNTAIIFKEKYGEGLDIQSSSNVFLLSSSLTMWMFAFLPAGITCGWIIRAWVVRKKANFSSKFWLVFSTLGLLALTWFLSPAIFSNVVDLLCIFTAYCLGVGIGLLSEDQSEGFPYHLADWLGYALTYGILGGSMILVGALGYFISMSLIGILNVGHLVYAYELEAEPVQQVLRLLEVINYYAWLGIVVSIAIGLLVISVAAFLRSFLGVKEFHTTEDRPRKVFRRI